MSNDACRNPNCGHPEDEHDSLLLFCTHPGCTCMSYQGEEDEPDDAA